jgi:hypothetical protein
MTRFVRADNSARSAIPREPISSSPPPRRRQLEAIAILFVILLVVIPQYYLAVAQPNEDWTVAIWAVALPAIVGSAVFLALGRRTYLFIFLAYLWSVTDDNPVNLDSIYSWPEVTSGLHHTVVEVLLHALTALFLYLAIREAFKGDRNLTPPKLFTVSLLTVAAFAAASVSIIPLPALQAAIPTNWYQIDVIGHAASIGLMCAAIWEAVKR